MAAHNYSSPSHYDPYRREDERAPTLPPLQHSAMSFDHDSMLPRYAPPSPAFDSTPLFRRPSDEHNERYYGAGSGGHQMNEDASSDYYGTRGGIGHQGRQYSDEIPLRDNPQRNPDSEAKLPRDGPHVQVGSDGLPLPAPGGRPKERRTRQREPEPEEKKGFWARKIPWVTYTMTLIQCTVFIVELVKNSILTSTPIEIHPQINPMLGPSFAVLVNMGASPNQWFRFITPVFLHAGFIHIGFNMLLQLTLGREMEKTIGSIRFLVVYLSSGIFGFVLGGNFAASGIASTGASGALFGLIAVNLLDLLYTWKERVSPKTELAFIVLDIVVSFVLGLLPGLDNFSHIGGFLMGLVLGVCILHSPNLLRKERVRSVVLTQPISESPEIVKKKPKKRAQRISYKEFSKDPVGFFRGRKILWWSWWLIRAMALIAVIGVFIVLLNNFYKYHDQCSWCSYLTCLHGVSDWCDQGNLTKQIGSSGGASKRDLFGIGHADLSGFL